MIHMVTWHLVYFIRPRLRWLGRPRNHFGLVKPTLAATAKVNQRRLSRMRRQLDNSERHQMPKAVFASRVSNQFLND